MITEKQQKKNQSDYDIIRKLVPALDQLQTYSKEDFEELIDMAKDICTDKSIKLLEEFILKFF